MGKTALNSNVKLMGVIVSVIGLTAMTVSAYVWSQSKIERNAEELRRCELRIAVNEKTTAESFVNLSDAIRRQGLLIERIATKLDVRTGN